MTILGDKEKEFEQLVYYIDKIVRSKDSKCLVTSDSFSVQISEPIDRTFSRAELESFEQQIKYLMALNEDFQLIKQSLDLFERYLKVLDSIRNRFNAGFNDFSYITKIQESPLQIEQKSELPNIHDIEKSARDRINLCPKNYYFIGKCILNYEDDGTSDTLSTLFYSFGFDKVNHDLIKKFRETLSTNKLSINPVKVGIKFVEYVSMNTIFPECQYRDFMLNDKIKFKKSYKKLSDFVQRFSDNLTLLIANVPKPCHTYHLIQPSYVLYSNLKSDKRMKCPLENIVFCSENDNFCDFLHNRMNSNDSNIYFIVHPENLKQNAIQCLKKFIYSRINKNKIIDDTKSFAPPVMIITALPPSFFYLNNNNIPADFIDSFDCDDIKEFAIFNAQWRRMMNSINNDVFLFSSDQLGFENSYMISKIINKSIDKFNSIQSKENKDYQILSKDNIFIDIATKEIPESIKDKTFVHISFSPEVFVNNFQFFDQLYLLIQYGYYFFKNGDTINYSNNFKFMPTFFIEIPNLDENIKFENFYDFPVAPSNNEHNSSKKIDIYEIIKDEFNNSDDREDFQNGLFHLIRKDHLLIDDNNVIHLMKLIFNDYLDIIYYSNLIEESCHFFFTDYNNEFINDGYVVSKFKQMIEDYSKLIINDYSEDEEMQRLLFLLTIRTALYIWHFIPKTSHTIILLVPQRLMTINAFKNKNGWIFVGFKSQLDKYNHWNSGKNVIPSVNSDFTLISMFEEKYQKNEQIHILSDDSPLQSQFFKTILLFLPLIDHAKNSLNPLNILHIILYFSSNMNHYPNNSFQQIIADLSNSEYTIEDCKKRIEDEDIEWTEIDEMLTYYLRNNKKINPSVLMNASDLILQLKSEVNNFDQIFKITFSKTYFARLIEIIIRIYYRCFSILQGDTGFGKSSVIHFLNDIICFAKSDPNIKFDIKWNIFIKNFNAFYSMEDFKQEMKDLNKEFNMNIKEMEVNKDNEKIIIFIDNINSGPAYYYSIDYIQHSLSNYFSFIAAINPFYKIKSKVRLLSYVGLPQNNVKQFNHIMLLRHPDESIKELTENYDANIYAYKVKEIPHPLYHGIINANPQNFNDDYFNNKTMQKFDIDEEKETMKIIIMKILLQWKNNKSIDISSTLKLLYRLIDRVFNFIRSFIKLHAIFSYRDVYRCITVFTNVFDYFIKHKLDNLEESDNIDLLTKKITSISAVISVYISFIVRFSQEEIDFDNKTMQKFENLCNSNTHKISLYKIIMSYVSNKDNWPDTKFPYINDWEHVSILFAYAKCIKYIINEESDIYPLPSLMLNLLILSLTVSISNKGSDHFKCLIIGMPGTSKSKSVEIFNNYYSRKKSKKHEYFVTTYLCSKQSDSDSLLSKSLNGACFMNEKSSFGSKSIIVLENYGALNYDQTHIINVLSDNGVQFKKGLNSSEYRRPIFVELSSYRVDFCDMNRSFLIYNRLPTDSEFYSSIALGTILKQSKIKDCFTEEKNFSQKVLYKITQLDRSIDNYEEMIDILINAVVTEIPNNFNEQKEFYKIMLENLWKITQCSQQRPSFYSFRQLLNLTNIVTKLKNSDMIYDYDINNIALILNSFIQDAKNIFNLEKESLVSSFLTSLNLPNQSYNPNSVILLRSFITGAINKKEILIRTENYEAYRYMDLLLEREGKTHFIYNFIPTKLNEIGKDFHNKYESLFNNLLKCMEHQTEEENNENYIFCFVGNDPFSDNIIDILNSINQENKCPILNLNGFSVFLPKIPKNIKFIFIINENEIWNLEKENSVSYLLIDRLDHLFLNKEILKEYNKDLPVNSYFNELQKKYLLNLPFSEEENEKKGNYLLNYDKSNFQYLIDAIENNNRNKILENHFKNTFVKNFNHLLTMMKRSSNEKYSSAIVFTKTPFWEKFSFDGIEDFEIINVKSNLGDEIEFIKESKNIIFRSDIFYFPDENTINNAFSIVNTLKNKIRTIFETFNEKGKKPCYIIIFHVNENRIPCGFGSTACFPNVWIEKLNDNQLLIQQLYQAIYYQQFTRDSNIISILYDKVLKDIIDYFNENQKNRKNKPNLDKIIERIIEKLFMINSSDENSYEQRNLPNISDIRNQICDILYEIQHSSQNDNRSKILNEELYNYDIEVKFIPIISNLIDYKYAIILFIIFKYISLINAKPKDIYSLIDITCDTVNRLSKISFIKVIDFDTFSSPVKNREINQKHPELIFYNILKPFFNDNYYKSLNKMKILIQNLHHSNIKYSLLDLFLYINDNYYNANGSLPFNLNDKSEDITIDTFNDLLNCRGLIAKNSNTREICEFIEEKENHLRPNLYINNTIITDLIEELVHNWKNVDYKQILLFDCQNSLFDKCNECYNPHPYILYSFLINDKAFSYDDYNVLPWIINFLLYGSFNYCKIQENNIDFIKKYTDFIENCFQANPTIFTKMITTSNQIKHFIYDYLFTSYCMKSTDKIDTFNYLDHIKEDETQLKSLLTKYPEILEILKDDSLLKSIYCGLSSELTQYDPSTFDPFSEQSIQIIKDNFKKIMEIEKKIEIYDSWKSHIIKELSDINIFDNIRLKLFKDMNDLDDKFGIWFLDSDIPLLTRQVYEICKSVKNNEKEKYETEFKILRNLINPWNDDNRTTLFFWKWFVSTLNSSSFSTVTELNNLLNNNPIKYILVNCLPYYFCEYENDDHEIKRCIISKRHDIKTFFIERLLYSSTILSTITEKSDNNTLQQIFKFISQLPFAKHTKNLYILAGFINEIMRDFRDQINILFLILNSFQNASDLLNVSNFKSLINDPKRTESPDLLANALNCVDKYNKGVNAAEKMKSYINKLIEINNSTNFPSYQYEIPKIHYRLVAKNNIHSNISLTNTFLPALAHLKFVNNDDEPYKLLLNAVKVLTGDKECKNIIDESEYLVSLPSIFDYSEGSNASQLFKNIEKIDDNKDLFGFPINDLARSLCDEIISFMLNESNNCSYRIKIWEMIENTMKSDEITDNAMILHTLIPLFEEYDESVLNEHLFFEWPNNSIPVKLEGINSAAYFLKSYQINGKSLFDIIEEESFRKETRVRKEEEERKKKEKEERLRKEEERKKKEREERLIKEKERLRKEEEERKQKEEEERKRKEEEERKRKEEEERKRKEEEERKQKEEEERKRKEEEERKRKEEEERKQKEEDEMKRKEEEERKRKEELKKTEKPKEAKKQICAACKKPIETDHCLYYSSLQYHFECVKCSVCNKTFSTGEKKDDYVCIAPGMFLCTVHYNEQQAPDGPNHEYMKEYEQKKKENILDELMNQSMLQIEDTSAYSPDDVLVTDEMVEGSIGKKQYEDILPTIALHVDKPPQAIDCDKLPEILGNDVAILDVEQKVRKKKTQVDEEEISTIITIALLSSIDLEPEEIAQNHQKYIDDLKKNLNSSIGNKAIIGNFVEEPKFDNPDVERVNKAFKKPSINQLQKSIEFNKDEIKEIRKKMIEKIKKDDSRKDWKFVFSHTDLFKDLEAQIRKDISDNPYEMIIVGQTIITSTHFAEYEKIKNQLSEKAHKCFLYHGSKLANHSKIAQDHFYNPAEDDKKVERRDKGYFGVGIYGTDNIFYAAKYANECHILEINEKTYVICCRSIYNKEKVNHITDLSMFGEDIDPETAENFGINHALVGSSSNYRPIYEEDKDKNEVWANEFVFPHKNQFIPCYSFTVMRKDHYILWKDENLDNNENSGYMKELSENAEVNIYGKKSVAEAVDVIKKKKYAAVKLITNAGGEQKTGRDLILQAREIIGTNFICLVFASNKYAQEHMKWISKMKNVILTTSNNEFREFASLKMNEAVVLKFINKIRRKYETKEYKFDIDEKELLRFPNCEDIPYYKSYHYRNPIQEYCNIS